MTGTAGIAASLVARGKGILAADESIATMSKRLEAQGIPASETARRDYRQLLLTTPGLPAWVSGVIFCDETLRQRLSDGRLVPEAAAELGIEAGIKVDTGVIPLPFAEGAVVTEGLDGLRRRLDEYRSLGATFAKWRAVIDPLRHPQAAAHANAPALARYAALCQEAGLVPIVEPEVLMDGDHDIDACAAATSIALAAVFDALEHARVSTAGMVLKPNMVLAGQMSGRESTPDEVAARTLEVLGALVPDGVPGVAFLSGGQSNERACTNLTAINRLAGEQGGARWALTFSFGRALVNDALQTWRGQPGKVVAAQQALAANCARAGGAAIPAGGRRLANA